MATGGSKSVAVPEGTVLAATNAELSAAENEEADAADAADADDAAADASTEDRDAEHASSQVIELVLELVEEAVVDVAAADGDGVNVILTSNGAIEEICDDSEAHNDEYERVQK